MDILQLSHPIIVSIAENKTVCEPVAVGYNRGGFIPKSTISTDWLVAEMPWLLSSEAIILEIVKEDCAWNHHPLVELAAV